MVDFQITKPNNFKQILNIFSPMSMLLGILFVNNSK